MSLITCPECKNSVSSHAGSCPKCGFPIKKVEHTSQYITNRDGIEKGRKQLDQLLKDGWRITSTVHEVETSEYDGDSWDVVEYFLER